MLNPWLSLSFQAARLGWETQRLVVDHWLRIAGMTASNRKEAGAFETLETLQTVSPEQGRVSVAPVPAPGTKNPQVAQKASNVAQKVSKIPKKSGVRSKRSRAKGNRFSSPAHHRH
jgi:hypothetical protein